MSDTTPLRALLGDARLASYLDVAGGDSALATDLYLWSTELSGALHAQISFVEIAVRNAMDAQLRTWNTAAGLGPDWTEERQTADPLYSLLKKQLKTARDWARDEAKERHGAHPRRGATVTHDDVLAQIMFGVWVKLVRPMAATDSPLKQQQLWTDALRHAFPHAAQDDRGRVELGSQLEQLRRLRNRVAHHDNLLAVDVRSRLNGMLSLLAKMDPHFADIASARSRLRTIAKEDPRLR